MTSASTNYPYLFPRSFLRIAARRLKRLSVIIVSLAIVWVSGPSLSAEAGALTFVQIPAAEPVPTTAADSAATLFEQNCAGCHVNGGNVIRRGKNLKKKAMARYGYSEVSAIADIITNGKGIMSAYGDRLNEEEIGAIAQYVHEQSEAGWQH